VAKVRGRNTDLLSGVLRIFLSCVEKVLHMCCPVAPENARLGAVTFVHQFGSALNGNLRFHCCVIDGVSSAGEETLWFDQAVITPEAIAKV